MIIIMQLTALVNLYYWFFGWDFFTALGIPMAAMKPLTAFLFVITGIMVLAMILNYNKEIKSKLTIYVVSSVSATIFIVVFFTLLIFAIDETIVVKELTLTKDEGPYTIAGYMPSIVALIGFLITYVIGVVYLYNTTRCEPRMKWLSMCLIAIGLSALIGYVLVIPELFFYSEDLGSNAMAVSTAICFIIAGVLFYLVSKKCLKKNV